MKSVVKALVCAAVVASSLSACSGSQPEATARNVSAPVDVPGAEANVVLVTKCGNGGICDNEERLVCDTKQGPGYLRDVVLDGKVIGELCLPAKATVASPEVQALVEAAR